MQGLPEDERNTTLSVLDCVSHQLTDGHEQLNNQQQSVCVSIFSKSSEPVGAFFTLTFIKILLQLKYLIKLYACTD